MSTTASAILYVARYMKDLCPRQRVCGGKCMLHARWEKITATGGYPRRPVCLYGYYWPSEWRSISCLKARMHWILDACVEENIWPILHHRCMAISSALVSHDANKFYNWNSFVPVATHMQRVELFNAYINHCHPPHHSQEHICRSTQQELLRETKLLDESFRRWCSRLKARRSSPRSSKTTMWLLWIFSLLGKFYRVQFQSWLKNHVEANCVLITTAPWLPAK